MILETERAGPYLRALRAGLNALAPNDDYVPLSEALAHIDALDPGLSRDLLLPAEVHDRSGLPAFAWMHRALSEQAVARASADRATVYGEFELKKAEALDPELAERLRARQRLHRHLRGANLLPVSHLDAALRRRGVASLDFSVIYDRLTADGLWTRIRLEVTSPKRRTDPFHLQPSGRVLVDDGLLHLLSRQGLIGLTVLRSQLQAALPGRILRLARSQVGPFWFPGCDAPPELPEAARRGLILNLSTEVVSEDVRESHHADPLRPIPEGEIAPEGQQIFRERRFAASPPGVGPLRSWAQGRGCQVIVTPL